MLAAKIPLAVYLSRGAKREVAGIVSVKNKAGVRAESRGKAYLRRCAKLLDPTNSRALVMLIRIGVYLYEISALIEEILVELAACLSW